MSFGESVAYTRERARRYALLDASRADWVPKVKALVRSAGADDWGTYIAACALLGDVLLPQERIEVDREIEYDEQWREQCRRKEIRNQAVKRASAVTGGVVAVAIDALCIANLSHPVVSKIVSYSVFSVFGAMLFALIGSVAAGRAMGCLECRREGSQAGVPVLKVVGFGALASVSSFILPPFCLVFSSYAWHLDAISQPGMSPQTGSNKSTDAAANNVMKRGTESRCNPRAPRFVRNAIRLASLYSDRKDQLGNIASMTLSRKQTDYGAFVAYEALLIDLSKNREAAEDLDEHPVEINRNGKDATKIAEAANNSDSEHNAEAGAEAMKDQRDSNPSRHVRHGLLSGLVVGLAMCGLWCIRAAKNVPPSVEATAITVSALAAIVLMCSIAGFRSGKRTASTSGLTDAFRSVAAVQRASWNSAWIAMISLLVLSIFLS